jgi:CobQ-like glutamine amidotransferase family enzyme
MSDVVLGSVFGGRLNLFGDQGNLLALKRFIESQGLSVSVVPVHNTQEALTCNFILVGHGSIAAMASIQDSLEQIDWRAVLSKVPTLAVGSGLEFLAKSHFPESHNWAKKERESEFQVVNFGVEAEFKVLGYRNTDSNFSGLKLLVNEKLGIGVYGSMLHGPVLAKNPKLLKVISDATLRSARKTGSHTHEYLAWVATLNDVSRRIWALEAPNEVFPELEI